ncbi:Vps16 [Vigna unguiculata]|uniref:Vps16 n=1 Tax=Vigna unguiculata TaxID=3917 RepID=A0A4D6MIB6_VIGUN|nr:Vps16 [Vigna unguiculata]
MAEIGLSVQKSSTNWLGPGIGFIGSASTTILHNDWKLSRGVYIFVLIGLVLLLGVISALIVVVKPWTADENLRLIRSSLLEAVEACVDAAGHEFDVSRQRTLLRAASYGQAFCSNFQRDRIQEMCKISRVLNVVRSPEIGIPLSIQQYKLLTPSVLIGRLITAHQHLLALKISEYLGMNQEVVIKHWACSKITASLAIPDAALLEILLDKLKLCKGISYAAVAAHADKSGRRKLAALLVEHEPRSSKQVLF